MFTWSGWTACFHPWSRASHSASLILTPWICTCLPRSLLWGLNERILCTMPVHRKFIKHLIIMLLTLSSIASNSLWSQGPQPTRRLCPWDSPGKNAAVGCHFFLQGIFLTQGLNPHLLHLLHWQAILFFFFLPLVLPGKPNNYVNHCYCSLSAKHGRTWKITKSFNGVSTRRERRLKYSSS